MGGNQSNENQDSDSQMIIRNVQKCVDKDLRTKYIILNALKDI